MSKKGLVTILMITLYCVLFLCSCRTSIKVSDTKSKGIDIRYKKIPQLVLILDKESFDEVYARKVYMHKNRNNRYINNDSYENALMAFETNYRSKIEPFDENEHYGYIRCKLLDYTLKDPLWPAFVDGFFLSVPLFLGMPLAYAKAEESIEIQILNLNNEIVKTYRYNTSCKKSSRLYNGFPLNYIEGSILGAFKKALNTFNQDLLADADNIKRNLISTAKAIKMDCLEAQYIGVEKDEYYQKGFALIQQKDFMNAINCFTESLSRSPLCAPSYFGRAVAKYNMGEYSSALKDINRLIQLSPNDDLAYYYKAAILCNLRKYTESVFFITKAITINSQNEDYHYLHGMILEKMGYFDDAIAEYRNVLTLNPDRVEVDDAITSLRRRIRNKEDEYYKANLENQIKALQILNSSLQNLGGGYSNNNILNSTNSSGSRTKLQIQNDLDKAKRLLEDMKKNQDMQYERMKNDRTSGISGAIYVDGYDRLIKKQEQRISGLENELRNAKK
ncbi:tetratricopeptide repeat protein [Bacteroides sp. GM023]|uniref:tetratricopeptide repeat protein n=1 Tax=Bacteroides sp. GM023 TaxID=2723058 RepID=UPI00168B27B5|nr:tetratricopeptide repeat protein [Bacteroides sp. GM023]MBD3588191.1 tetratricopeptide repeat protein [Bacteroides sp. GM023]